MSRYGLPPSLGGSGSIQGGHAADLMLANYVSGMQVNGRMSAVRRFFCLFVTFDLLFTCLFWIICILINGENLVKALEEEVEHYSIKFSMFDIVMAAMTRFTVLLLFYALLHINHWWLVAITTALSCAFLIVKVLLYKWNNKTSYPFEVMLILISFFIAWSEAWFIDFRVIPQEARAKSILEAANNSEQLERDPLLPQLERVRDYLSHYSETVGDFYSPMESPVGSDEEDDDYTQKQTPQEKQMQASGYAALEKAWEAINSCGWTIDRETTHNDKIHTKESSRGTRIFRLTAILDADPKALFYEMLNNFENLPAWNSAVTETRIIQSIDSCTDIIYQVAAEGPGGTVKARDFVDVRHWRKIGDSWVSASVSVIHKDLPPRKTMVRGENGPGCWVFRPVEDKPHKCLFQWLLDTDLKGWIPNYVVDQALTSAMLDFAKCLRSHITSLKLKSHEWNQAR